MFCLDVIPYRMRTLVGVALFLAGYQPKTALPKLFVSSALPAGGLLFFLKPICYVLHYFPTISGCNFFSTCRPSLGSMLAHHFGWLCSQLVRAWLVSASLSLNIQLLKHASGTMRVQQDPDSHSAQCLLTYQHKAARWVPVDWLPLR